MKEKASKRNSIFPYNYARIIFSTFYLTDHEILEL